MNLQLGVGLALAHGIVPRLHAFERSLELSLSSRDAQSHGSLNFTGFHFQEPVLAALGEGWRDAYENKQPPQDHVYMMARKEGGDRAITYEVEDYEALAQRAMSDREVLDYLRILAEAGDSLATQALALAASEGNAQAVFVLRDFVNEGDDEAFVLLRNLDIHHLVQLALHDPEATWALHYLEQLKNVDAIQVMNGLDLSEEEGDSMEVKNDLLDLDPGLWVSGPRDKKGPPN
jgi:hypothetical protein